MSFFKLLSLVFKKDEESPKTNFQEKVKSVTLSETAQEINDKKAEYVRKAAQDTLELCTGIPDEIKKALIELFPKVGFCTTAETPEARDELFKLLDGLDWKWSEWEYWRPIAIELRTMTTGMCNYCHPEADKINWENARSKYSPEKVFNLMSLKDIKAKFNDNAEIQNMKRAEFIEYLKNNESAWFSIIDSHIQSQWDKKKHNEGPTPKRIFNLMCYTIQSRAADLDSLSVAQESGISSKLVPLDEYFYSESIKEKYSNQPWKKSYEPRVPGMSVFRQYNY